MERETSLPILHRTGGNNDAQYSRPEYDAAIDAAKATSVQSERMTAFHQAEDMLMDTGAVMPIYYYNDIYMLKSNIKGIYSTIYGMKYFMYATKDK